MKRPYSKRFQGVAGGFLLLAVLVLPAWVLAGTRKIYVDDDASGTQDGSSSHPFRTISQAIDKAGDDSAEIVVASGTYKENITLPKGVTLTGAGSGKTTLKAKDDDDAVVVMKHRTRLRGVTVKEGKVGVFVKEDSRAEITDSVIEDNRREGVIVKKAPRDNDRKMSIVDTEVSGNGRTGVFSERRKIVFVDSKIRDNKGDGVSLEAGTEAYFEDNSIRENGGSGLSLVLDRSSIFIASKNVFQKNKRDGIEIGSFGAAGSLTVKKSRFTDNARYGIARVQRKAVPESAWSGVNAEKTNIFAGNAKGTVSPVTRGY
jgi:hypothetical protein